MSVEESVHMMQGSSKGQRILAEFHSPLELSSCQISLNMHLVGERQRQADTDLCFWNFHVVCCLNKIEGYFRDKTYLYICINMHIHNIVMATIIGITKNHSL